MTFSPRSRDRKVNLTDGLLLDTHVFLWWQENNPRLRKQTRQLIATADLVCVSAVSALEVAIKAAVGKLRLRAAFAEGVSQSGFVELAIGFEHAAALGELPRHHADPFDRILVAQSRVEGLALVTHDQSFRLYDVPVVWA